MELPPGIARNRKTGKLLNAHGRLVAGITHDGVAILQPPRGPTNFTTAEIRRTIKEIRAAQSAG